MKLTKFCWKKLSEDNVYDHLLMINKKTAVGTDGISYQNLIELWPRVKASLEQEIIS